MFSFLICKSNEHCLNDVHTSASQLSSTVSISYSKIEGSSYTVLFFSIEVVFSREDSKKINERNILIDEGLSFILVCF